MLKAFDFFLKFINGHVAFPCSSFKYILKHEKFSNKVKYWVRVSFSFPLSFCIFISIDMLFTPTSTSSSSSSHVLDDYKTLSQVIFHFFSFHIFFPASFLFYVSLLNACIYSQKILFIKKESEPFVNVTFGFFRTEKEKENFKDHNMEF